MIVERSMKEGHQRTMKVVILAGGYGTRISEETTSKPKPMVELGGKPLLWHIMKIYSHYGYHDFIICLGYKGYMIKEYFANYFLHMSNVTFDIQNNRMDVHQNYAEPWRVTLIDTGVDTMTGGRIKRIAEYVGKETFMMTYGDGVGDINIPELVSIHKGHGKYVTVTATQPSGRFGAMRIDENGHVVSFIEKPSGDGGWVNGGFFVMEPQVFDYIDGDETPWEKEPMERLAAHNQLISYKHYGFWQPVDTLRDMRHLEDIFSKKKAPWVLW